MCVCACACVCVYMGGRGVDTSPNHCKLNQAKGEARRGTVGGAVRGTVGVAGVGGRRTEEWCSVPHHTSPPPTVLTTPTQALPTTVLPRTHLPTSPAPHAPAPHSPAGCGVLQQQAARRVAECAAGGGRLPRSLPVRRPAPDGAHGSHGGRARLQAQGEGGGACVCVCVCVCVCGLACVLVCVFGCACVPKEN